MNVRRSASALLALALLCSCGERKAALPLSGKIDNTEQVVEAIRSGLRGHAKRITISFRYGGDIYEELNAAVGGWVEASLAETTESTEGDYLRCQLGGYSWDSAYSLEDGAWRYTVQIVPDYYDYLAQEEAVTAEVIALLEEFGFSEETPEDEKLETVYDFICRNVRYDKVHKKNPYSHLKSTAYGALVLRSATCQGYCAALYRLLRECGVSCRIVRGAAGGEIHAWVIAEADGRYYNLDPTWDAGAEEYRYFLAGSAAFSDHEPEARFLTEEFIRRYPVARESYREEGWK